MIWNNAFPSSINNTALSCRAAFTLSVWPSRYFKPIDLSVLAKQTSAVPMLNGTGVNPDEMMTIVDHGHNGFVMVFDGLPC